MFQVISNVRCQCRLYAKKSEYWNLSKHRGEKMKTNPLKNIGNEFSLRAVHNNGKTIKNMGCRKGEIVIHRR